MYSALCISVSREVVRENSVSTRRVSESFTLSSTFEIAESDAAALMTSFLVLTGSLAFFVGRNEAGELGFHALLLLGSYPVDVFAGSAKLVLYTVVPAAFVSSVPARLIQTFDGRSAAGLITVGLLFIISAHTVFRLGLRRYASGSVWTRA